MAATGVINVEEELRGLRTMVTDLIDRVSHLNHDVSGLMADRDGGVYGGTYAADRGPAIRALFFERLERANDEHVRRTSMLTDQVTGFEATMGMVAGIQTGYNESVDRLIAATQKLESDMRDMSGRVGATPSSAPPGSMGRLSVTGMKGFEKLKNYGGDPLHWKDWRFKTQTWLEQINRSFHTLIPKFDVSETDPPEPEAGHRMRVGATELTTEEEWCGEELYQLLVQKCEGPALAIVRNQNTLGKARGLIAWFRTVRDAEGQVKEKMSEITERVFYSGRKAVAPRR